MKGKEWGCREEALGSYIVLCFIYGGRTFLQLFHGTPFHSAVVELSFSEGIGRAADFIIQATGCLRETSSLSGLCSHRHSKVEEES